MAVIALLLRYLQERLRAALLRKSPTETETETLFRTGIFLPATFQQKVSIGISTMERTGLSFKRTEGVETEHSRLQQKTLRFASSEKAAAVEAIDSSSEVGGEPRRYCDTKEDSEQAAEDTLVEPPPTKQPPKALNLSKFSEKSIFEPMRMRRQCVPTAVVPTAVAPPLEDLVTFSEENVEDEQEVAKDANDEGDMREEDLALVPRPHAEALHGDRKRDFLHCVLHQTRRCRS